MISKTQRKIIGTIAFLLVIYTVPSMLYKGCDKYVESHKPPSKTLTAVGHINHRYLTLLSIKYDIDRETCRQLISEATGIDPYFVSEEDEIIEYNEAVKELIDRYQKETGLPKEKLASLLIDVFRIYDGERESFTYSPEPYDP